MEQAVAIRIDPQMLLAKAIDGKASIETLERLLALAKDVREVQAREAWHQAMADFQRRCPSIKKTKKAEIATARGFYSYTYAPLDEIMETIRPLLGELGLSVAWTSRVEPQRVVVACRISHALGYSQDSGEISMPIPDASERGGGNPAQRVGSALTYARRYSLLQVTGLAPEDDDDAQSVGHAARPKESTGEEPPPHPPSAVTFPFDLKGVDIPLKGRAPGELTADQLHRILARWEALAEKSDEKYQAHNQAIVRAIQESIAEKTAKPESPAAQAPSPADGVESPPPPAGEPLQMPDLEQAWVRVTELLEAKGKTKAWLTKHCKEKLQQPDPAKLGLLEVGSIIAYLGTLEG